MRLFTGSITKGTRAILLWLMILVILLTSCRTDELIKAKADLAACQTMVVYLLCLNENEESFCNDYLCEQYPDAEPCGGE